MALYGEHKVLERTKSGTLVRKYVGNAFKPRPELRVSPKSRKHFPLCQRSGFCIRAGHCANDGRSGVCGDACIRYSGWKEKK
jgi:hypothetical protein